MAADLGETCGFIVLLARLLFAVGPIPKRIEPRNGSRLSAVPSEMRCLLIGGFDLLNVGDLELISRAHETCESVVLGVLADDVFDALHGRRPYVPEGDRAKVMADIRGVEDVVIYRQDGTEASSIEVDVVMTSDDPPTRELGTSHASARALPVRVLPMSRRTASKLLLSVLPGRPLA